MIQPGFFVGTIRHRRSAPTPHAFAYPLFMAFLDIDRIPELMGVSRLTSVNRWNWASFDDRDHLGQPGLPLRARVQAAAGAVGLELPKGPIYLLTHLRYLGYCFNPVSFYYAFDQAMRLQYILADVHNTFGGTHQYWLRLAPMRDGCGPYRASAEKALYVSPFLPMDLSYQIGRAHV